MAHIKLKRRDAIKLMTGTVAAAAGAGAAIAQAGAGTTTAASGAGAAAARTGKVFQGVVPVAQTPYTTSGAVDWDDLANEMNHYSRCGVQGVIWPAGGSDYDMLSKDERMKGMQVVADACRPLKMVSILAVQSASTSQMLDYAHQAEKLNPDALYISPPYSPPGTKPPPSEETYKHFAALGAMTKRPVIVFANVNLVPSIDVLKELVKKFPNFAYIRTDGQPAYEHIKSLVEAKPPFKSIFGASACSRWLYEERLGVDGIMTDTGMYADVMEQMWRAYRAGQRKKAADIYSKLLLMMNLDEPLEAYREKIIPGTGRYVLHKRGWFKTTTMRARQGLGRPYALKHVVLRPEEKAEVDLRFSMLEPYLAKGA